jgi:putative toxin-antitoxin system antitoxin component (TIGR02293 family)
MAFATFTPTQTITNHPVAQVLGLHARNLVHLSQQIETGLPIQALHTLGDSLEVNQPDLARLLNVSVRTLQRKTDALSPQVSDHLYRLGNLLEISSRFHGNREAAVAWLKTPNIALAGALPLDYARTEIGNQAVLDLLGGLEHGVVQ